MIGLAPAEGGDAGFRRVMRRLISKGSEVVV